MLQLFKFIGLGIVFCACAAAGLYKSYILKKRAEKLSGFFRGLNGLAERIRCHGGEAERLLPLCFEKELVFISEGKPQICKDFLCLEDIELLKEFFADFGMKNSAEEYERTILYASLAEKQYLKAEKSCNELCRLYGTLGVLCGIFICIFFL